MAVLLVFTLATGQVFQICRGETVDSVVTVQKDRSKTEKTETNQKDLNEKVLARLTELEAKIEKKEENKKEDKAKTPKNIFVRAFMGIKNGAFFTINFFWGLNAVLSKCVYLLSIFLLGLAMNKSEEVGKCFESALDLFEFLKVNPGLAEGILNKLFENISGNYGDHNMTSEEKKRINDFAKEILKRFHPDNINRLKNLTKEDLETITTKTNILLDAIGK